MFALKEHYRHIVYYKAAGVLGSEASKTHFSFLWWLFDPIMSMAVYYLMFGVFLQRGTEDFVPFLLVGLVCWQWFSNTIIHSASSINNGSGLISQIAFPKIILPSVAIAVDSFKFIIVFTLLLVFLSIYGFRPNIQYVWLPVLLLINYVLIVGCSYISSLLTVFVPDIQHILSHLLRMMMYLSGILYPISAIPESFHYLFVLNPMALIINCYRDILMYSVAPNLFHLTIIAGFSLGIAGLGQWLLGKFDNILPRIVLQR